MAKKFYQLNQYIKADTLRVVDKDAKQLGVVSKSEALKLATLQKLDLVLVAPSAKPPVAKIVNFATFKYQQKKKEQQSKKKSKSLEIKEIRLTPFIASNDLETRLKKAKEFLEAGDKVKINVKFIGRQITRKEFGFKVIEQATNSLSAISSIDTPPKMVGRMLQATLKPTKKAKTGQANQTSTKQ